MIIRIMLVCMLLVMVGCGDYTSGLYDSDYDGGGYTSRYDACEFMCTDHCNQCWMFYTEQYRCTTDCRNQCVIMACDSLDFSSRCYDMYREICTGG